MKYVLVGDIHGVVPHLERARKENPEIPVIQVGDFGYGFNDEAWDQNTTKWCQENDVRFIRGNHDYPDMCKTVPTWIEDGHFENDIMFIGGAYSIDRGNRTAGFDWWHDEEISDRAFENILEKYLDLKPKVVVSHDGPHELLKRMFCDHGNVMTTRTGYWLEVMRYAHKPQAWVFGHWHLNRTLKFEGTLFRCVGIGDNITLDTALLK